MSSIRRPVLASAALAAVLALTATACGPSDDKASGSDNASASTDQGDKSGDDGFKLPKDLPTSLKDLDKWKNGAWKNWSKDDWLREARDFVNPIIKGHWKPETMKDAHTSDKTLGTKDFSGDQGVTDPEPSPVQAKPVGLPYTQNAAPVGKVFFDSPQGHMVCSATVVKDPAHPGKSNMVWTAGHCVHAGKKGGWYRNIAFVPAYNNKGLPASQLNSAPEQDVAPYGAWWADWAQTSSQWISQGAESGGAGAPYDFSVLHVKQENGTGKSLEETVGAALPVNFDAPQAPQISSMGAWGYPAAAPFDGQKMYDCIDKPGRLTLQAQQPTMYRIGCTMTAGSSGGGWVATGKDGQPALVSNTSIGPSTAGWLAGPRLGPEAKAIFDEVSKKYAGQ
ncbi:trypsin-like serine peptidase [Streptomyces sp. NPDC057654]|uniref:trypsin-like serine peptidase n=1 Tax=Streptomyces sp. NPDC057654 TaxID=3346196 RepID=UPI00368858C8